MVGSEEPFDMDGASAGSLRSRRALLAGSVGGLGHAGLAMVLWASFGHDDLGELLAVKPHLGLYILLGMVLLGFVPAVFYVGRRAVSPAVVVGAMLLLTVVGSWFAGPVRAPAGAPTPFGLYILLWVGIVALAAVAGRIEATRRRGPRSTPR